MAREASGFDAADGRVVIWVPALVGVGLLASLLLTVLALAPAAGTRPLDSRRSAAAVGPLPVGPPILRSAAAPAEQPSPGTTVSPPRRTGSAHPSPRPAASIPPRTALPADVTGRYRVVNSYRTGFIAEVVVSNASGGPRPWSVRLEFASTVGVIQTFWVDSQPEPTLRRSGRAYVFAGSVPVAARSSVALRVQFDRSGPDRGLVSCSTNGLTCGGR